LADIRYKQTKYADEQQAYLHVYLFGKLHGAFMPAPSQDQESSYVIVLFMFNDLRFVLLIMVELLTDHHINFLFIISSEIYS